LVKHEADNLQGYRDLRKRRDVPEVQAETIKVRGAKYLVIISFTHFEKQVKKLKLSLYRP
jgi:hypothetical protein